ncbi:MAG TPA: hypothetical protein VK525_13345 [Candidatus Saccharimonadales bacterium]|nr:hypothetical protein [Candidatus Saccharimonadales bacterium]
MDRKPTAILVGVVFGAFFAAQTAAAQDPRLEASPLDVTTEFSLGLNADCKQGQGLVVAFHYLGTQPLRGYLVRLAVGDKRNGKMLQDETLQEVRDSREPAIESGAEWTRTVCAVPTKVPGEHPSFTAKVDVLKFADGSVWGPAALPESHRLIGTLDGMDFIEKKTELQKFVSPILPEQGPPHAGNIESRTIGPLRIESGVWRDERGQDKLTVELTNVSATAIRGYLFTTSFVDPATGNRIRRVSTKELETHGNPADYLAPGSSWVADSRKFSYLPDGQLAAYTIDLDLVVFADGTTFGPKRSQESDEMLGMFDGIDRAKRKSQEAAASTGH